MLEGDSSTSPGGMSNATLADQTTAPVEVSKRETSWSFVLTSAEPRRCQ
jgi:hypothetical protein